MILAVSWRNIWRNRTRSLVIIAAIAIGVFAGVYTIAFMLGWVNQRIDAVIGTEISHIQLHQADFLATQEVHDYMPDASEVAAALSGSAGVKAVSSRILTTCMIATAETGTGVMLTGINPALEREITNIHELITEGSYFEEERANQIVIGEKLAKKLRAGVRSRVVVTLTEMDGTLTGGAFRVAGIYRSANSAYDEMKAFVRDTDLRNLIKLEEGAAHEIAVLMSENGSEQEFAGIVGGSYPDRSVMTWTQLLPEMELMNESMNLMMYIFIIIILLALGFGIVNTMLMVVLERVKELGMLMAVGMNRLKVFVMIVTETVLLCLTGGVIGIIIAVVLTALTAKTGIDLSFWSEGLNSLGFDAVIYPEIGLSQLLVVAFLVALTGVLAALYPARKAIRLRPAEALRIDM
ncbi:MAG: ABC transporter permease [Bacteroidales bacterium]|jgi:ABC-type lipoprotein release transport system permease subunit|nr:ABC transporter permease [Bacteroidales bacterium]